MTGTDAPGQQERLPRCPGAQVDMIPTRANCHPWVSDTVRYGPEVQYSPVQYTLYSGSSNAI